MAEPVQEKKDDKATPVVTQPPQQENQTPPAPPAFDPSKVDASDSEQMEKLTAEQLNAVEQYQEEQKQKPPAKEPVAPPAKDTEKPDTSKGEQKPVETPGQDGEKLAGKYSTFDELVKGVEQLADKMGFSNTALAAMLEAAKENKAVKTVEKLYKQLEVEMGRKANEKKPPEPSPSPAQADTPGVLDTSGSQELLRQVTALTYQQLAASPLASQMRARGLEIPTTPEQLETLIDTNPYFAMQFESEFKNHFNGNLKEAREFAQATKTAPSHNQQAIDSGVSTVKDFIGGQGITLTDAEIESLKAEALANPFNYEERHGVRFLRANAIRDTFMASVLPKKLADIKSALLAQGREEALKDIEKNKNREIRSISTSGSKPTDAVVNSKKIDENNPEEIEALSDQELDRYGT